MILPPKNLGGICKNYLLPNSPLSSENENNKKRVYGTPSLEKFLSFAPYFTNKSKIKFCFSNEIFLKLSRKSFIEFISSVFFMTSYW